MDLNLQNKILKNKVILITGASQGIGKATAIALAELGAQTILLARSNRNLNAVADSIVANNSPEPYIIPFNLSGATYQDYLNLADSISAKFNCLDGLILNAATLGQLTPIEHYDLKIWYEVMQVNLNSQFLMLQALLPLLKKSTNANIIFTIPPKNHQFTAYWGAYGVAQGALQAFYEILTAEYKNYPNININKVYPDKIDTNLRKAAFPAANNNNLTSPKIFAQKYIEIMLTKHCEVNL